MARFLTLILIVVGFGLVGVATVQSVPQKDDEPPDCRQDRAEQDKLLREAQENRFNIHRIATSGNTYTRFRDFRKVMSDDFNDGFVFNIAILEENVRRIAKIKTIFPITTDNVVIQLDRDRKEINFVFCVKQRSKS